MKDPNTSAGTNNLWILSKLKDCTYAIDCEYVKAIFVLEDEISVSPDSDDVHLGIVSHWGQVLPIIDLRRFLGIESKAQEAEQFEQMLEQRKQDHIRWVNELKRCVEEEDTFRLATDPHQCAFGKWYDNYESNNQVIAFHMKKIDEPHQKLHATAHEALSCARNCAECSREECLRGSLRKAIEVYMPTVVNLLEEAKTVFQENDRKMVVVTSMGSRQFGLLVDEVLSVEPLFSILANAPTGIFHADQIVSHVAQRNEDSDLVLLLNMEQLYHVC